MHYMISLVLLELLLLITCLTGDLVLLRSEAGLVKAACDSATHASIGLLSWLLAIFHTSVLAVVRAHWDELLVAFLFSAFIDLDHFIEARSLSLKAAISLPYRPFLHCSSIPVLILVASNLVALLYKQRFVLRAGLLIFSSIFSHHVRDAARRGLWFYGLPSIQLSYNIYVVLELALPLFYRYFLAVHPSYKQLDSENVFLV